MTHDIQTEIARRLELAPDDVAPALEMVVQRIRQQVEHYGYARLSGLGTFRQLEGGFVFEPDAALAETVNARFTGLADLELEPAGSAPPSPLPAGEGDLERDAASDAESDVGAVPAHDTDASDAEYDAAPEPPPNADDLDEPDLPGARAEKRDEVRDEVPDEEPAAEPDAEPAAEPVEEPAAETDEEPDAETDAETDEEPDEETEPAFREEEDYTFWNDAKRSDAGHPLGPGTEPPYEEADFSVLGERRDAPDDSSEPTVSWAPLGEAKPESPPPASGTDDDPVSESEDAPVSAADDTAVPGANERTGEESGNGPDEPRGIGNEEMEEAMTTGLPETRRSGDPRTAPDRSAAPHGLRSDGPVRTIRPPRRSTSSKQRDLKPLWFGAGILVIVAAAAIAYLTLPDQPAGPAATETTRMEAPAALDTSAQAAAEGTDSLAAAEPAPPSTPPSTPLRGTEDIDPADGGFTIVAYSETNQDLAAQEADRYRDLGYRAVVVTSQSDGVTRYRVGVGQFESLESATENRNDLAGGDLPADAWVLRL